MYLPGMGPKRKDILNRELHIQTWGELLEYYPYKYVDRSRIYTIVELSVDMPFVQIKGKILSFEEFVNGVEDLNNITTEDYRDKSKKYERYKKYLIKCLMREKSVENLLILLKEKALSTWGKALSMFY